jgi:hypothetical protein
MIGSEVWQDMLDEEHSKEHQFKLRYTDTHFRGDTP